MKYSTKSNPEVNFPPMARAFRSLAAALRTAKSVDEFLDAVGRVLPALPGMESMALHSGCEALEFSKDALIVPINGHRGAVGVLEVRPSGAASIDAGQLQLAAAVADMVSAMVASDFAESRRAAANESVAGEPVLAPDSLAVRNERG